MGRSVYLNCVIIQRRNVEKNSAHIASLRRNNTFVHILVKKFFFSPPYIVSQPGHYKYGTKGKWQGSRNRNSLVVSRVKGIWPLFLAQQNIRRDVPVGHIGRENRLVCLRFSYPFPEYPVSSHSRGFHGLACVWFPAIVRIVYLAYSYYMRIK